MPEARIVLSQVATYLASAPKSNAAIRAIEWALRDAREHEAEPVPLYLRNAPTKLMKELNYGSAYKYAHDYPGNFVQEQYLPDGLKDRVYYHPTKNGAEASILERLTNLWKGKKR
jgi:putative ATPase